MMDPKIIDIVDSRAEYYEKQAAQEFPDIEKVDFSDLNEAMAKMKATISEIVKILSE